MWSHDFVRWTSKSVVETGTHPAEMVRVRTMNTPLTGNPMRS